MVAKKWQSDIDKLNHHLVFNVDFRIKYPREF